jgi:hypothetical protein
MNPKTEFCCLRCGKARKEIELRRDPVTDAYFCREECWDARSTYLGTPESVDFRSRPNSERYRRQHEHRRDRTGDRYPYGVLEPDPTEGGA